MSQAFHGGQIEAARREFQRDDFIDFSSNLNVFLPEISANEWVTLLDDVAHYPEPDAKLLRNKLAEIEQVNPGHLIPTSGASEALYLAARLFTQARPAILEPSFSDYHRAFAAAGVDAARVVLPPALWNDSTLAWRELLEPFDVVVLGNPNNPTGAFQMRDDLLALIDHPWSQPKSWIIDEAFIEFAPKYPDASLLNALGERSNVIVLRSLTKSWRIPGLRLGFLATSSADWLARLALMQPPWSVNAAAQAWAESTLTSATHAAMLASLEQLPEARAKFAAGLTALGCEVFRSAANFLFVRLPGSGASAAYRALGRRGFLVRRCDSFYGLTPADSYLRLAVRWPRENEQLLEALAREIPTEAAA